MIDIKQLKALVKLMVDNDLTELDLADDKGEKVKLKRGSDSPTPSVQWVAPPAGGPPATTTGDVAQPPAETKKDDGGVTITSPTVGTFYAAPSPDADPFVKVGDRVSADTVVCLVEAMKVFNEIKAETSGVITAVLVESGQAIQFGDPLFKVKPS